MNREELTRGTSESTYTRTSASRLRHLPPPYDDGSHRNKCCKRRYRTPKTTHPLTLVLSMVDGASRTDEQTHARTDRVIGSEESFFSVSFFLFPRLVQVLTLGPHGQFFCARLPTIPCFTRPHPIKRGRQQNRADGHRLSQTSL